MLYLSVHSWKVLYDHFHDLYFLLLWDMGVTLIEKKKHYWGELEQAPSLRDYYVDGISVCMVVIPYYIVGPNSKLHENLW